MRVVLELCDSSQYEAENISLLQWSAAVNVACDGLSLNFFNNVPVGEVNKVFLYDDFECLLFSGYSDVQKNTISKNSCSQFIYARSSAALLVDNEACPGTLNKPTSVQLFASYAKEYGFINALPKVMAKDIYEVTKGTSCFGVLNSFIETLHGTPIWITPKGEICAHALSENVYILNELEILSAQSVTERGGLVSVYDYKTSSKDSYAHHMKSRFCEKIGIRKRRFFNLSALPAWQRDGMVKRKLQDTVQNYKVLNLVANGFEDIPLYSQCVFKNDVLGEFAEYVLHEKTVVINENGVQTKLKLKKQIDLEEITYVA